MTRRADTRIFQNMSVPDILKELFPTFSSDFKFSLFATYPKRDYCVQYRESDFAFASRLMEQEGIYYYFEHTADRHLMVLADQGTVHTPFPGHAEFRYRAQDLGAIEYEAITDWRFSQQITTGKFSLNDYDFENPKTSLLVDKTKDRGHTGSKFEQYDPLIGDYTGSPGGQRYAALRMEEEHARYALARGTGTMSALTTGYRFTLVEHPRKDQNCDYVVVSARFELRHPGYESGADAVASYRCEFTALDSREVFRPQRLTPRPVLHGPQTAVVTGPAGEEIFTDKYGRIKVQFHWDRLGKLDEHSSCWIRVAQSSAGGGFGAVWLPRIGHEVVVEFLEGDPDRPLVTGSVYNGQNATPYELPAQDTVSTLKSRSTLGGKASTFNELRFEDKQGSEYIFVQAEKDHLHLVKADRSTEIGQDEFVRIERDRKQEIKGFTHLTVRGDTLQRVDGDAHNDIGGDALLKVGGEHGVKAGGDATLDADQSVSLKSGTDMHQKAGMNYAVDAGMNLHIKGGINVVIEAGVMLTLKVGGNSVVINPAGVSITGTMVLINSGGAAGSGAGASPVAPSTPKPPELPPQLSDPLPSR